MFKDVIKELFSRKKWVTTHLTLVIIIFEAVTVVFGLSNPDRSKVDVALSSFLLGFSIMFMSHWVMTAWVVATIRSTIERATREV